MGGISQGRRQDFRWAFKAWYKECEESGVRERLAQNLLLKIKTLSTEILWK